MKIRKKSSKQIHKNIEGRGLENREVESFQRRIVNTDSTSCWLNCCIQLLLIAFDSKLPIDLNSNLGAQLKILHSIDDTVPLDPSPIRLLLTETDDLRIETEKNELKQVIKDPRELRKRLRDKENSKLNLGTGQQCARDCFVCLRENRESWPDVYSFLNYNVKDTTICRMCGNISSNEEREEIYTELICPSDGSQLGMSIEKYFNQGELVEYKCGKCNYQQIYSLIKSYIESTLK